MVNFIKVSSQKRDRLAEQIAEAINKMNIANRIVGIVQFGASDGKTSKFFGTDMLGEYVAYIYYIQ